jgi:divalent metal cation (Fe/Co/Zn/Cd) transporter/predicted Fe-Mo cluster-binding NifX family protein
LLGFGISILIFYTGIVFFIEAIQELDFSNFQGDLKFNIVGIIIPLSSVILLYFDSYYLTKVAKKTNSPSLKAEAINIKTDSYINLGILLGMIVAFFQYPILDLILVIAIALMIFYSGFETLKYSLKDILDLGLSEDDKNKIFEICRDKTIINEILNEIKKRDDSFSLDINSLIFEFNKINGRSSGRYLFLELSVKINPKLTLLEIAIIEKYVKEKILDNFSHIESILFNFQPYKHDKIKIAVPIKNNDALNSELENHFGDAKYFAVISKHKNSNPTVEILGNPYLNVEKKKGILIAEWLATFGIDFVLVKKTLNKGPTLALNNSRIEIQVQESKFLKNINFDCFFE